MITGAQGVFGGDAAGVANDVGVASLEAEKLLDGKARVHAGEDGQFFGGGHGEAGFVEFGGVLLIGCEDFVGDAHDGGRPFVRLVRFWSNDLTIRDEK
jgi:hypothetical protein